MSVDPSVVLKRPRNKLGIKKRQENLDNLIRLTNATPFRDVRWVHICYFCNSERDNAAHLKIHTIHDHLGILEAIKVVSDRSMKLDITDLKCLTCGSNLPSLENAFDHLRTEHQVQIHTDAKDHLVPFKFEGDTQKCVVCDRQFPTFKVLNDHINLKHYKNYECAECGRGFITKRSLQAHGYTHETGSSRARFAAKSSRYALG